MNYHKCCYHCKKIALETLHWKHCLFKDSVFLLNFSHRGYLKVLFLFQNRDYCYFEFLNEYFQEPWQSILIRSEMFRFLSPSLRVVFLVSQFDYPYPQFIDLCHSTICSFFSTFSLIFVLRHFSHQSLPPLSSKQSWYWSRDDRNLGCYRVVSLTSDFIALRLYFESGGFKSKA